MNEIIEKAGQTDLENKKDNNPLSVRVDQLLLQKARI